MRTRVLSGAVLWSLGLALAVLVTVTTLMIHQRWIAVSIHGTAETHSVVLLILVAGLLGLGFLQIRRAWLPLADLRWRLSEVRSGTTHTIEGIYPAEVQPLVDDLNALLEHQERAVRRAIAKAGDLAHGLKTPLAVLTHEADRAASSGHRDVAATIAEQVHRMRRQVDYHLAHARAAASGATPGATTVLVESAEGLARTLRRLHASRGIEIVVNVDPAHRVQVQRDDLDEMLGNLMDNACEWTRSRVTVTAAREGDTGVIAVEDDGPGVDPAKRTAVLQRGVRADEANTGSGLGLAIVRDIAELYGGSIALDAAPSGGLRAVLRLPATSAEARQRG